METQVKEIVSERVDSALGKQRERDEYEAKLNAERMAWKKELMEKFVTAS